MGGVEAEKEGKGSGRVEKGRVEAEKERKGSGKVERGGVICTGRA